MPPSTGVKLLLLPGIEGSGVLFEPLLAALAPSISPVVVAFPRDQALGYDELVELVVTQIPSEGPYVVLGESFSGPLALFVAARAKRPPIGVILCCTFIRDPTRWIPAWIKAVLPDSAYGLYGVLALIKAALTGYGTPAFRSMLKRAYAQLPARTLAARAKAIFTVDAGEPLRAYAGPILYLRGERDHIVPESSLQQILRVRAAVEVVRLQAPHLILQMQPRQSADAIADFVDRAARIDAILFREVGQ